RPNNSDKKCYNCSQVRHLAKDCWQKGGGKEGQGPHQKLVQSAAAAMTTQDFAFATTTLTGETAVVSTPSQWHGAIVDSGAMSHFCPNHSKFRTFTPIPPKPI
ncbi:hypothetical protein F5141DRAFT_977383, partial [Pisolithus sp. B1]